MDADLQGYIDFIKAIIEKSLFPEEKLILEKGLQFFRITLDEYIIINSPNEEQRKTDSYFDLDISRLPEITLEKYRLLIANRPNLKWDERCDKYAEDLLQVWIAITVIILDFAKSTTGAKVVLTNVKSTVRNLGKLRTRMGDLPDCLSTFENNMQREISALNEEINETQPVVTTYPILSELELKALEELTVSLEYWPYTIDKLNRLYELLLAENLIQSNEYFLDGFKAEHKLNKNKTVWTGTQRQMLYLFHLIFSGKALYKNQMLHNIAIYIFCPPDNKDYSAKSLSTTYNQMKPKIEANELTPSLAAIQDLFDKLQITK